MDDDSYNPDDQSDALGWFGHPATEDEPCARPEDCGHPICRAEAARIERLGRTHSEDHQMQAFLTGSRAYGTPRHDSDIDLCIMVSNADMEKLTARSSQTHTRGSGAGAGSDASLRFGSLNLLCFTREEEFLAWQEATEELIAKRPVTREQAIQLIDEKVDAARGALVEVFP